MRLYHGSTVDISDIDLSLSKPNKDFGRAFYLSDDLRQAQEMANFRAAFEETEPIVNIFEFDETLFQQFRYKRFEAYTEDWAHFVYDHRTEPHAHRRDAAQRARDRTDGHQLLEWRRHFNQLQHHPCVGVYRHTGD